MAPAELRDRLLDCVDRVLRRDGVEGLSLRAVAREAGVSHAAPAHWFLNKRGLLTAYAAAAFHELAEALQAAEREAPAPADALVAVGMAYVRFAVSRPDRFQVMWRRDLLDPDSDELRLAVGSAWAVIERLFAAASAAGHISDTEEAAARLSAWSMAHGVATLALHTQGLAAEHPLPEADAAFRLFARQVLATAP